jgi:hypothetical protein
MPDITHTEYAVTHARVGDALNLFAYDGTIDIDTRIETDDKVMSEARYIRRETRYRVRATPDGTGLLAETRNTHNTDSKYSRKRYTRTNIDEVNF